MLGRAAAKAANQQPQPKSLEKQMFPSSSPAQNGNIEEGFKTARNSTSSIGGFTNYKNTANPSVQHPYKPTAAKPLRPRSPNTAQRSRSTTSSTMGSIFEKESSIFSRADSFQDTQTTNIFSQDTVPKAHPAIDLHSVAPFDENDFDDDDIDMDFELPASAPMAAPPRPIPPKQTVNSQSPYNLPQPSRNTISRTPGPQAPSSSAVTWASSSPSHKRTPPGVKRPRDVVQYPTLPTVEADTDARPAKRRSLPWLAERAQKDETVASSEEWVDDVVDLTQESSSSSHICMHCKGSHPSAKCPKPGKWNYTPKEKKMPWNNTGSAVREEKMKFKEKQKASRKADSAQHAAVDSHRRSTAKMAPISLSQEQQRVLDLVVNQSKSVFFTGSAGTGKSVLMRAIIAELRKKYKKEVDRVAVTASTGLAACNVGGVTLHSFGGIGLGKEDIPTLVKKIKRNPKAKNRWIKTKILVIDEISMVDGDLFDKLEGIARAMRNNGRPFGGIQLVITGDFFQLPPVPDSDNKARGIKFAFDAGTWSTAIHHTIGLTEVFRQKDPVFANMLNEMRLGKITDETVAAFKKLNRKPTFEDSLEATELFPMRHEVENSNAFRMRSLVGKGYRYDAADTGTVTDQGMRDKLLSNMMAPKTIELKKGAQVMLIKNMDEGLVNGSLGKVIAFMSEVTFEIYDNNPELFEDGGEPLNDEVRKAIDKPSLKARFGNSKDPSPNTGREYPLVAFNLADGTVRHLLVMPEEWKIELPSGEVQAQRSQLPLILAWALSIHKAQGQTLERVKIDLKRIFENGQAYVALSRAVSQEGLEVHNFDKSKVMAHPRVAQFYNSLYSVNKAMEHPRVAAAAYSKPVTKSEKPSKRNSNYGIDSFSDEEELMAAFG